MSPVAFVGVCAGAAGGLLVYEVASNSGFTTLCGVSGAIIGGSSGYFGGKILSKTTSLVVGVTGAVIEKVGKEKMNVGSMMKSTEENLSMAIPLYTVGGIITGGVIGTIVGSILDNYSQYVFGGALVATAIWYVKSQN